MTRIRGNAVPPQDVGVTIDLILGPTEGGLSLEQLEIAWQAYGPEMLRSGKGEAGHRPWAYWFFEVGEEQPERADEPVRLAELGELTDDEIAAIAEKANEAKLRVDTPAERISGGGDHPDVRDAELWERVQAAMR